MQALITEYKFISAYILLKLQVTSLAFTVNFKKLEKKYRNGT